MCAYFSDVATIENIQSPTAPYFIGQREFTFNLFTKYNIP